MKTAPDSIPQSLQDLLPKWAHFCLYTERFITRELGVDLEGKLLLVGISGGVDSTALLMVLHYLSQRNGFKVVAVHLDHQLRPESGDDAAWVASLCEKIGVKSIIESQDVATLANESGIGTEEAGRNARYHLFEKALESESADFVALAHHLDDLSEDVLMRLMRGTGWPGLSGMPGIDPLRRLIRPFLMLPKSTLIAFVKHLTIEWREDDTNAEPDWTRNRIRNDVMPLFLKENPNFRESIGRLWKIGKIEQEYWDELTAASSDEISNEILETTHKAVRLKLYKASLDALGPGQTLASTLFGLDDAWQENRIGAVLQFPGEKTATITASGVVFSLKH